MRVAAAALELFFPEDCLHCRERTAENGLLCQRCTGTLSTFAGSANTQAGHARNHALLYQGAGKALFSAAKFANRRRALHQLLPWAEQSLRPLNTPESCFIQMPSSRPFLHRLLSAILPQHKIARGIFAFEKTATRGQNKLLKESERFRRIAETLKISRRDLPRAETYILCDDVFTTGATLGHAAWLLQTEFSLKPEQIQLWTLMYRERLFEDAAD